MKVLIISDIHGNLPALEHVLSREKNADLVISLGDVVNYGPWSNECADRLEVLPQKVLLRGNHEEAFLSGAYPGNNEVAKAFFNFCYPLFDSKETITGYINDYTYDDCYFVHTLNNAYIFPDTEVVLDRNTFIGHSHRLFSRFENGYRLVNAGSVGQCRTNADEVNYVIWYPKQQRIEMVIEQFDATPLINEMKRQGYPQICIDYILFKRKKN